MSDREEFWRYVDGIKFSAAVAALETFNTRGPAASSLSRLFAVIGREMQLLVQSDRQFHLFTNPDLKQLHIADCTTAAPYEELLPDRVEFRYTFDPRDQLAWRLFTFDGHAMTAHANASVRYARGDDDFPPALNARIGSPKYVAIAPFCRGDTPFGFFLFCWYQAEIPTMFADSIEGRDLREGAPSVLDYLHRLVTQLVSNHYPVSRDTYVPSFQQQGLRNTCVVFADIRNFTSAFETSRLVSSSRYPELLVGLTKAYLEAASIIIAEPGIGRIDKFLGDGIMATFGDYVVGHEEGTVACLLAIYASVLLENAFRKLLVAFRGHSAFQGFLREYNDVVNLRLGIGINYGQVVFDYFGSMGYPSGVSNLIGGYSEYTAVGDNVNAAQRLEGLAAKQVTQVALLERSDYRQHKSPNLIAPIVMSRTAFIRIADHALRPLGNLDSTWDEKYRSAFALKGKGSAVEAYEVFPDEVNGDRLIRRIASLGGKTLADKISPRWSTEGFRFDDATVTELATRYFPS